MNFTDEPISWVVYRRTHRVKNKVQTLNAVCEQSEWEVMCVAEPGVVELVQAGFANENDAEKSARGATEHIHSRYRSRK
jgi:hypothetical protein